jgi:hypothetical protein
MSGARNRCPAVRSATMITRPNQIKPVLEDEQDTCSIELAADIAVATQ